jgi:hypothetical protein
MGFGAGRIGANQITASSVFNQDLIKYGAGQARLNGLSAWRPIGTNREKLTVSPTW